MKRFDELAEPGIQAPPNDFNPDLLFQPILFAPV
jgi:hypothetical protein